MLLNSVQIALMIRHKRTKTPFDISMIGVCIADLIASLLWFITSLSTYVFKVYSRYYFIMMDAGLILSIVSSLLSTLFIAVQRSFAVFSPFKFRTYFTRQRCLKCLVFIWITSILVSFLVKYLGNFHIYSVVVLACGCLLVMCYLILCRTVHKQRHIVSSNTVQNRSRHNRKTMLYCVLITITFVVCTFPLALLLGNIVKSPKAYLQILVRWLMALNPVFDSLLYFIFNRNVLCCWIQSPERSNINGNKESTKRFGDVELGEMQRNIHHNASGRINANHVNEP